MEENLIPSRSRWSIAGGKRMIRGAATQMKKNRINSVLCRWINPKWWSKGRKKITCCSSRCGCCWRRGRRDEQQRTKGGVERWRRWRLTMESRKYSNRKTTGRRKRQSVERHICQKKKAGKQTRRYQGAVAKTHASDSIDWNIGLQLIIPRLKLTTARFALAFRMWL
ncbi:unnamed protein product [Lactuca saligna]|uniref:Uncharacterized protein n=1 Tax=Lactuca saligna TaxID=75948 RepID=A0AA35VEZ6_LACSI|nr:unnamed protein product [Lactuca saligna]